MAVFPERIILKSTTDSDSSTVSQISPNNGSSPIKPGELVIRRDNGYAYLYTIDALGNPVVVSTELDQSATILNTALIKLAFNTNVTDDTAADDTWISTSPYPSAGAAKYGDRGLELNGSEALLGSWTASPGRLFSFGFWLKQHVLDPATSNATAIIMGGATTSAWDQASPYVYVANTQATIDSLNTTWGIDTTGMVPGCLIMLDKQTVNPGIDRNLLCSTLDHSANDGQWHYYLFQGEPGGTYSVYVDGTLKQRRTSPGGEVIWSTQSSWFIGGYRDWSDRGLNGYLDGISWHAGINLASGSSHPVPSSEPDASVSIVALSQLSDVALNNLQSSDLLSYNGQKWVNIPSGGTPSVTFINDLADVDTTNLVSADGQALGWNETLQRWERKDLTVELASDLTPSLGGDLNIETFRIFTDQNNAIKLDPEVTGFVDIGYGATNNISASLRLESRDGFGSVILRSHDGNPSATQISDSRQYTITFPFDGPQNEGDVLSYVGSGVYTYRAPRVEWSTIIDAPYVPAISDTLSPSQGQALLWNQVTSQYEPGDVSTSAGESLQLEDLSDVVYTGAAGTYTSFEQGEEEFTDGDGAGLVSTEQAYVGTRSFLLPGSSRQAGYRMKALQSATGLYDIYSMRVYCSGDGGYSNWRFPVAASDGTSATNNSYDIAISNAGVDFRAAQQTGGGGFPIQDHSSPTTLALDTWHQVFVQVYYPNGRTRSQLTGNCSVVISVWVNGEKWADEATLNAGPGQFALPELDEDSKNFYLYSPYIATPDKIFYDKFYGWNSTTPFLAMDSGDIADVAANESAIDALFSDERSPGDALVWDGHVWGPGVITLSGGIDQLDDVDTSTTPPSSNQVLAWDGSSWTPASQADLTSSGFLESHGTATEYPLAGIDGFYADQAAMEADGFTFIANSANADDAALVFSPPAKFNGVDYLGNGITSGGQWFLNSNGGVGWDLNSQSTNARSFNALNDAVNIDFYVSWWSEDTESRLSGWKEITDNDRTWLVVRSDQKVPFNNETGGYPVEAWFATDGSISIRYGTKIGTGNDFVAAVNRNVIVSNGSAVGTNPLPSLTAAGQYSYNRLFSPGFNLGDLNDVDTSTSAPTDGQALIWVDANSQWEPGNAAGGGISDAPSDGNQYARQDGGWTVVQAPAATIDDLTDVDTSTVAPTVNQVLVWNGTNWVPGDQSSGGGSGGGASASYLEDTQTSDAGGLCTFTGLGTNGTLVNVSSVAAAWIALYATSSARTADAARAYGTDPTPGSGVLAEFYVSAGGEVLASPGATYFNADSPAAESIYAAVRDQAGAAVSTNVTISAYGVSPTLVGQRSAKVSTTASLADGASENVTITGAGRSGRLISIETDAAAWVVVYSDTASRTADASRASTADPAPGSGVLCEVLTTGAQRIKLTPAVGYFNDENPVLSELYLKVENRSGGNAVITVTTTLVPAED